MQDEGSQVAALLADARPGMRVVDFCAGAGGKTLALAAQMKNRGKLVACDVSDWRLERAGQRLRRAGISNVERRTAVERARPVGQAPRRAASTGCSSTRRASASAAGGATRTANGAPGRRTSPNWSSRQRDILASAARLVKPGGRLIYVTCSLLREENEAQAEAFLAAHADFALYPAARAWAETIGGRSPAATTTCA